MNKQEQIRQGAGVDGDNQTQPGWTPKAIAETMNSPTFTVEQLPELWQQAVKNGGLLHRARWVSELAKLWRSCDTYPQYAKMAANLSILPTAALQDSSRYTNRGETLAEQATTEQLLQALKYGQNRPEAGWQVGEHIIKHAEATQLTAQIVEQLPWQGFFVHYTDMPTALIDDDTWRRYRQIIELVQQELLDGDDDAWTIFHGISEHGQTIGDIVELALAIAQKQLRV